MSNVLPRINPKMLALHSRIALPGAGNRGLSSLAPAPSTFENKMVVC